MSVLTIHFNIKFYNFFYMLGVNDYHNLEIFEYSDIQYNIQYNCLFRAPIAKNKSYSKALYIVQCTVTTILLSVVNLKKMSFQFGFE